MKTKILGIFAVALLFGSCSSDDGGSIDTSLLTRKWYYKNSVINGVTSDYNDHQPGCEKDYIEFKANGVFRSVDLYNQECLADIDTGTWSVSGSTLAIDFTEPHEIETNTINFVTETTLQTQFLFDEDEDGEMEVVIYNFTSEQ